MMTLASVKTLSKRVPSAAAIMALTVFGVSAHAADLDQITVHGSTTKTVDRDYATGAPVVETTVKVGVSFDPVTLTTDSGVTILKDSVAEAARQACTMAGPLDDDGGTCLRNAISSARAQVDRAIEQARSRSNG